ncbi:MAG: hypothetical protein KDB03_08285 [Planctomycetales bacterium]|nr:hypothetical protein [Planctomycetales bacterium]
MNSRINHLAIALLIELACQTAPVLADDWISWPSTYTHDVYGNRIDQYALPRQPIQEIPADYQRSGYRSYRSTLQVGQFADNFHVVDQWGAPVIPYERWRFPYGPYNTPYSQWGPQMPSVYFNGSAPLPGQYPVMPLQAPQYGSPWLPQYPPQSSNWQPGQYPPSPFGASSSPLNGSLPWYPPYLHQPWFDGSYPTFPPN